MKKVTRILTVLFAFFILSSCGNKKESIETVDKQIVTYDVDLSIDFIPNLFFNKYDVELKIDDENTGYLKHGEDFRKQCILEEGNHTIEFWCADDSSIHNSVNLDVDSNIEVEYKIECSSNKININLEHLFKESDVSENQVRITKSAYDYISEDYKKVVEELTQQGFSNITTEPIYDIFWGITEEESIKTISINEKNDFKSGDIFDKDSEIKIVYHLNEEDDPSIVTTTKATTTQLATEIITTTEKSQTKITTSVTTNENTSETTTYINEEVTTIVTTTQIVIPTIPGYTPLQSLYFDLEGIQTYSDIKGLINKYKLKSFTDFRSDDGTEKDAYDGHIYISTENNTNDRYSSYKFDVDYIDVFVERMNMDESLKIAKAHYYFKETPYNVEYSAKGNLVGNHYFVCKGYISVDPTMTFSSLSNAFDYAKSLR